MGEGDLDVWSGLIILGIILGPFIACGLLATIGLILLLRPQQSTKQAGAMMILAAIVTISVWLNYAW
ncbi:MAG: hypothetical protein HoeaKO_34220 [Hoeflea alexandrii]